MANKLIEKHSISGTKKLYEVNVIMTSYTLNTISNKISTQLLNTIGRIMEILPLNANKHK